MFLIQKLSICGVSKTNIIPSSSPSMRLNMRPSALEAGVSAISAFRLIFLPSAAVMMRTQVLFCALEEKEKRRSNAGTIRAFLEMVMILYPQDSVHPFMGLEEKIELDAQLIQIGVAQAGIVEPLIRVAEIPVHPFNLALNAEHLASGISRAT